jgi:hypothetical protein
MKLTSELIKKASSVQPWDLANDILYKLCHEHPEHTDSQAIIAKIYLIGRAYAAAIERRKPVSEEQFNGDFFYTNKVAPEIQNSDIDKWFLQLRGFEEINDQNSRRILEVHYEVTKIFYKISGLEKRSLASKYLHFHFPRLFFIFDTRARNALGEFSSITRRATRNDTGVDNDYSKFFEKCRRLRNYIHEEYQIEFLPRHLDNLLLDVASAKSVKI